MDKWVRDKLKEWKAAGITPAEVLELWEAEQKEARDEQKENWKSSEKGRAWKEQYYSKGGGFSQLRARKKVRGIEERQRQVRQTSDRRKKERNPARTMAQTAISNALRDKLITRPTVCSLSEPLNGTHEGRIEADHHKGYESEFHLDVLWVCHACHVVLEKQRRGVSYGRHGGSR